MPTVQDIRITKGLELSEYGTIVENIDGSFSVPSQADSSKSYGVSLVHNVWTCDCADFFYRHITCKHVYATKFFLTVKFYTKQEIPTLKVFAEDARPCV